MVEDAHVRNHRPLFVIDHQGVKQYVDTPLLALAPDRDREPSPAVVLDLAVQPGGAPAPAGI